MRASIFSSESVSPRITVHLGPAGDAGLDLVADHVALDQRPVQLVVRDGVRPRPDDAHAALQHVDELRQLIQEVLRRKAPERRDAGVVLARLRDAGCRPRSRVIERNL